MYRLVLLDIDNTLYDADAAYKAAEEAVFKELQRRYNLLTWEIFIEHYKKARSLVHKELAGSASMHNRFLYFQAMMEMMGLTLEPGILLRLTNLYWRTVFRVSKPFPGVKQTLRKLKEYNVRIGVVTDLLAHIQAEKLLRLGVDRYIDFMVSSEEAGREKPHPSIYLTALHKARIPPEDAVMVGDDIEKDVLGAKDVGITGVLFGSEDPRADYSITKFEELLPIVLGERRKGRTRKRFIFIHLRVLEEGNWERVMGSLVKLGIRVVAYGERSVKELIEIGRSLPVRTVFYRQRSRKHLYEHLFDVTRAIPWKSLIVDERESYLRTARHLMAKTVLWKNWKEPFIPDYFAQKPEDVLEAARLLL